MVTKQSKKIYTKERLKIEAEYGHNTNGVNYGILVLAVILSLYIKGDYNGK